MRRVFKEAADHAQPKSTKEKKFEFLKAMEAGSFFVVTDPDSLQLAVTTLPRLVDDADGEVRAAALNDIHRLLLCVSRDTQLSAQSQSMVVLRNGLVDPQFKNVSTEDRVMIRQLVKMIEQLGTS